MSTHVIFLLINRLNAKFVINISKFKWLIIILEYILKKSKELLKFYKEALMEIELI